MGITQQIGASSIIKPGVCTSSTRPASPYEGQMIYETDTNRVLVYDNSAWVMIADTDTPPGMQLIKTQTITSSSLTVSVDNVFSSEWDNYRITITDIQSTGNNELTMKMGTTATGYYGNFSYVLYSGTSFVLSPQNNANYWLLAITDSSAPSTSTSFDLMQPFLTKRTICLGNHYGRGYMGNFGASLENSTSYTSFTLANSSGSLTSGTIRVYGYRNS